MVNIKKNDTRVQLTLSKEMKEKLNTMSEKMGLSASQIVDILVMKVDTNLVKDKLDFYEMKIVKNSK